MVWFVLADTAANATAAATIALAVFALAALLGLWEARKTRHGEVIADLSRRWDDPQVLESVRLGREFDAARKVELIHRLWGPADVREKDEKVWLRLYDVWLKLCIYPNVIENIGVFISLDVIKEEAVFDMWGPEIMSAWKEWADPIDKLQTATKTRETFRHFSETAEAMRRINDERTPLPSFP